MKAVIQRVKNASVTVDDRVCGSCGEGFLILFCAVCGDTAEDIDLLAAKTVKLRIFEDSSDKMNLSLLDIAGEVLCVSQFTLAANTKKGNRPSFINAMPPEAAEKYYDLYCEKLKELGVKAVQKGIFGADMSVSLINDGPVTIILDTDTWKKGTNYDKS